MALTSAEKQRRYRERQRQKLGDNAIKKKDAERKRLKRNEDNQKARQNERIRQSKSRAQRRLAKQANISLYKSNSGFRKAVSRVTVALPKSPRKKR